MKTTAIGVYTSQDHALQAARLLKDNGYTDKQISILWKHEEVDEEREKVSDKITKISAAEVGTGFTIGGTLGVLTGIGIFAIPGLGFLYGAGALVGAIAGIDFGVIVGSIVGALSIPGVKAHHEKKYDEYLQAGNFLLMVQGGADEMQKAQTILLEHGLSSDVELHA